MNHQPPKLASWLLRFFCRREYHDEVVGDFYETFNWRVESEGIQRAKMRSLQDAFSAIRLMRVQNNTTVKLNLFAMISLKVTLRSFWRNKLQTGVNLSGLACGFMVFLAVFQYVSFEKSYDTFNPEAENVYRVKTTLTRNDEIQREGAESMAALGPTGEAELPGVVAYTKLYNIGAKNNCVISLAENPNRSFQETLIQYASESFPQMFALEMLEGDRASALTEPFQVVISSSVAQKYFPESSAMGKQIVFDDDDGNHEVLTVSGVFKDYPGNSHLEFDLLISFKTLFARSSDGQNYGLERYANNWLGRLDFITYFQVTPTTDPLLLKEPLEEMANEQLEGDYEEYAFLFDLTSISDLHMVEGLRGDMKETVDPVKLDILMAVGVFVLVLAWVNFINLTTATALGRARETGIRKVLGGTRNQLVWQFTFESVFIGMLSFILSLVLFHFSFPFFNQFLPVTQEWYLWSSTMNVVFILALVLASGILAGIYPALVLSGFSPTMVLKGLMKTSKKDVNVRRGLVLLQSSISIFLITGVLAVVRQVDYMMNTDLGMEPEKVLVVPSPGNLNNNEIRGGEDRFRNGLLNKTFVKSYAAANVLPGTYIRWQTDLALTRDGQEVRTSGIFAQYEYLKTMGIPLVAGRDFPGNSTDITYVILNESAVRLLGFESNEDVVNRTVFADGRERTVIGVMQDYHHENLKEDITPMVLKAREDQFSYFFLKLETDQLNSNMAEIEKVFTDVFPGNPFEPYFLDDHFNKNYVYEQSFGKSFAFFSLIAMLVAVIGLYSLSSFITISRSKEIGIRKVLGARVFTIMNLLNKDFVKLICMAALLATPLSIWAVEYWLESFPYRISLGVMFFVMPGLVLLLVSLITVSLKTVTASRLNPVQLLKRD